MWPIKRLLSATAVFLLLGGRLASAAERAPETPKLPERPARTSGRDVKIPRALVQTIEQDYRLFLTENEVSRKARIKRQLLNLNADLTQKRVQSLREDGLLKVLEGVTTPSEIFGALGWNRC